MRTKVVLSLVVLVFLAVSMQAAEPFIVLVDEERGLLLIPEGTAVPSGIEFSLTSDRGVPRSMLAANAVEGEGAAPRRFVYAYAAPEKFAEARRRIAEAEATMPDGLAERVDEGGAPRRAEDRKAAMTGVPRPGKIALNIADFDQTYYYYFWDNSYHAMRKKILNVSNGAVQYTAYGYVYSAAGEWDTKVVVTNTCPQPERPYWNQSKTCWFYNAEGNCTPTIATLNTTQSVTATINSQATLTRYLYPPCDLPCKSNSSSTASVSFP
jgi:hypothetical protein